MLFKEEVRTMDELIDKVIDSSPVDTFKVSVVCLIMDKDGKLILHRRGPGARDNVGKLLAVGGSFNQTDNDFRSAMKRELMEECGTNCTIELNDFLGCQLSGGIDRTIDKYVNWVVLGYKGNLVDGDLENKEPDRCAGFESDTLENYSVNPDVSSTVKKFIEGMNI